MVSGSVKSSVGILVALLSAATFATSGPFAKSLLETGWTPGSVVFLRIAGAALILLVPTLRALGGRWHLVRREWRTVLGYGLGAVALPQLAFFYAVQHLSVGVALLLEYLGLVLVVAWQCLAARRWPRLPTLVGIVLALVGLTLVLDLFGGVRVDGVGVAWGLLAAVGLASYYLMSGSSHETALPPLTLAGGGLLVGGAGLRRGRWHGRAADGVPHRPGLSWPAPRCPGGSPSSSSERSRPPRRTSPASSRPASSGRSWPRSSDSRRSCSPCCSRGCCSGSCRDRCSCWVGCSSWPAWWPCVRRSPDPNGSTERTTRTPRQRLNRTCRSALLCSARAR